MRRGRPPRWIGCKRIDLRVILVANVKIQWIKYSSRGFRARERFKLAIYFHCGGLGLDPR